MAAAPRLRRACRVLLGAGGILGVALVATVVGLTTPSGQNVAAEGIRRGLQRALAPGWTVDRPRLRFDKTGRLTLDEVHLRDPEGADVISVRHLDALLDLSGWRGRAIAAPIVRGDGIVVTLTIDEEGVLDIVRAFGGPGVADPDAPPWGGLPLDLMLPDVSLRDAHFRLLKRRADGTTTLVDVVDLRVAGGVRLPLHQPTVDLSGLRIGGHLLAPGPTSVALAGDATWSGDDLTLRGVILDLLDTHGTVDGTLSDLSSRPMLDAVLKLDALDLPSVDTLAHARLGGRFTGEVIVRGPFDGLAVSADLTGVGETSGRLILSEGTFVCLARPTDGPDPCGGPAGEDPELRWKAALDLTDVKLEQIIPASRGPLVLQGRIDASGHGLRWPAGLSIDQARWEGEALHAFGIDVRALAGDITLVNGVLGLSNLSLTGVAGTVHGSGTIDIQGGLMDLDLYGPLDLSMLRDQGINDVTGTGTYTAHLTGDIRATGVPIDVKGEVWLRPLRYGKDVTIDRVHGRYTAHVQDAITTVKAVVDGSGAHTWGAEMATLAVPDLNVLVAEEIIVGGTAKVPRITYGSSIHIDTVSAPFRFDKPRKGGEPHVVAHAKVGETALRDLLGNRGDIDVDLRGQRIDLDVDLRWDDDPFLIIPDMVVDLSTLSLYGPSISFGPTGRQLWSTSRPWKLTVNGPGISDADLAFHSSFGSIDLTGTVGTTGPVDAHLVLMDLDLDVAAELFPDKLSGLDGVVNLDATLTGDAKHPTLRASIDAVQLFVPGTTRWLDLNGTFGLERDVLHLDLDAGLGEAPLVSLRGFTPVVSDLAGPGLSDEGSADLHLLVNPGDLERFELVVPDLDLPDGQISGDASLTGDLRDPDLNVRGVAQLAVEGLPEGGRVELDINRVGGELVASADVYDGLHTSMVIDGRADTRMSEIMHWLLGGGDKPDFTDLTLFADDIALTADLRSVPFETMQAITGTDYDVTGTADGVVTIVGSPTEPVVSADLRLEGRGADIPFDARIVVAEDEGGLHATVDLGQEDVRWLTASGTVPLRINPTQAWSTWGVGDLAITLGGSGIPLSLARVALPELEAREGVLKIAGSVAGTLQRPLPDVVFATWGADMTWRPLGLSMREVELAARLTADPAGDSTGDLLLSLERLNLNTQPATLSLQALSIGTPSRISATGSMKLVDGQPADTTAAIDLSSAWLAASDNLQLRVSGALRAQGLWSNLDVSGKVGVDQGYAVLHAADLLEARTSTLDPALIVHRGTTIGQTSAEKPPSFLDRLNVQVDVDLGRSMRTRITMPLFEDLGAFSANVTRADIDARLGGELEVQLRQGDIAIVGGVVLYDGELSVLRSHFDLLDSSSITFLGRDYANPRLDIHGEMTVGSGEIRMDVGGTAAHPKVDFSSDDFSTNAELFTILITGQSPEDLSSAEGKMAVEAVSDLLVNSVLGGVNLGSVSVDPDGTLHIGLPVYRTVLVESTLKPVPPPINENRVQVVAEWNIIPKLLMTVAYGDRKIWADFGWEVRF